MVCVLVLDKEMQNISLKKKFNFLHTSWTKYKFSKKREVYLFIYFKVAHRLMWSCQVAHQQRVREAEHSAWVTTTIFSSPTIQNQETMCCPDVSWFWTQCADRLRYRFFFQEVNSEVKSSVSSASHLIITILHPRLCDVLVLSPSVNKLKKIHRARFNRVSFDSCFIFQSRKNLVCSISPHHRKEPEIRNAPSKHHFQGFQTWFRKKKKLN